MTCHSGRGITRPDNKVVLGLEAYSAGGRSSSGVIDNGIMVPVAVSDHLDLDGFHDLPQGLNLMVPVDTFSSISAMAARIFSGSVPVGPFADGIGSHHYGRVGRGGHHIRFESGLFSNAWINCGFPEQWNPCQGRW